MKKIFLIIISILILLPVLLFSGRRATLIVAFLDVGQGDSILIITPQNHVVLIDGGNPGQEEVIFKYLKKFKIEKRIDFIIATHPHADHIGGLIPVLKKYDVGAIYEPGMPYSSYLYEKFLETIMLKQDEYATDEEEEKISDIMAGKEHFEYYTPRAGKVLSIDSLLRTVILSPPRLYKNTRSDPNNNSIVIKMTYTEVSFLFTGDIEREAESYLLSLGSKLRAQILKVAHHGSAYATSKRFLKLVNPKVAIICVGEGNPYGHPAPSTLRRLHNAGIKIYRTDLHGTIIVKSDGIKYSVTPEKRPSEGIVLSQSYKQTKDSIDSKEQWTKKININYATAEELLSLPGIGAFKARMIVRYRNKYGKFNSINDLIKVPGINKAILAKIKDKIVVR